MVYVWATQVSIDHSHNYSIFKDSTTTFSSTNSPGSSTGSRSSPSTSTSIRAVGTSSTPPLAKCGSSSMSEMMVQFKLCP